MRWFRRRQDDGRRLLVEGARLVADAEAFLSGNYARILQNHGDAVPGWAYLNMIAHGDLRSLHQTRRAPGRANSSMAVADLSEETWRNAQRTLATELLELVNDDPQMLARVQQRFLVPLELQLMNTETGSNVTVSELLQFTRAAFRCIP